MKKRGDAFVEVLLDEVDAEVDGTRAEDSSTGGRSRRPCRPLPTRFRSRSIAVVAALGLGFVVVQQAVVAAGEAADATLLGRSVSLARPLDEAWHLKDARAIGWVGDDLLVTGYDGGGTRRIDPRTGLERWSVKTTGMCVVLGDQVWSAASTVGLQRLDGVPIVCFGPADNGDTTGQTGPLVVIDSADGRVGPGPSVDGDVIMVFPTGRDVVVASATTDGRLLAERWSPSSGETVWNYASAVGVLDLGSREMTIGADLLHVEGRESVDVDLATGRAPETDGDESYSVVIGDQGSDGATVVTLPDGSTVTSSLDSSLTFVHTASDGTALPSLPGWPTGGGVDDGSAPGTVMLRGQDGSVIAADLTTGRTQWSISGTQVVATIDGRVAVLGVDALTVLDIGTGKAVWSVPLSADNIGGVAVSDGQWLGFIAPPDGGSASDGRGWALCVVDMVSGDERWRLRLDTDREAAWLVGTATDGTVVVETTSGRLSGFLP